MHFLKIMNYSYDQRCHTYLAFLTCDSRACTGINNKINDEFQLAGICHVGLGRVLAGQLNSTKPLSV